MILKSSFFVLPVVVFTTSVVFSQTPSTSCIIDEGTRDESLVAFRRDLLTALRSRSFDKLRPLLSSDVDASEVGGDTAIGPDAFRSTHKLNDPGSSYWMFMLLRQQNGRWRVAAVKTFD